MSVLFVLVGCLLGSCQPRAISGAEYLTDGPRIGKVTVINISDELRFAPKTGELTVGDSLRPDPPALNKLIDFMAQHPRSTAELKVSHIYRTADYYQEGLQKSKNLRHYFISRGIAPSRLSSSTFLDRRSKYPYSTEFRKVLVVLTHIPDQP